MTTQGDLEYVPGILQELSFDCHIYIYLLSDLQKYIGLQVSLVIHGHVIAADC